MLALANRLQPAHHASELPGLELALVAALALAAGGYLFAWARVRLSGRPIVSRRRVAAYLAGIVSLLVALLGPIDQLSDSLFTAHMIQHMLLTVVAPPLLLLGWPLPVLLRALPAGRRGGLTRWLARRPWSIIAHPVGACVLYNVVFLGWHLPALYQAAVESLPLHLLEHATFFWTALLFWWTLIGPAPRACRPSPTLAALLVFATWLAGDLLGVLVTLARQPIYPLYAAAPKTWGLTPASDQWLGGLIMWAGGGALWAAVLIGMLAYPYLKRVRAGDQPVQPRPLGPTGRRSEPAAVPNVR